MTARTRKPEARPDEILDAALDMFDAVGFDAARMEDVAARSGLSKAGVYLYFESKTALLHALITRTVAPIAQRAAALADAGGADPVAAFHAIGAVLGAALSDPRVFAVPRLVVGVAPRFPEIAATYRAEVVTPARKAIRHLIETGIAQGVFRNVDPDQAVRTFIGPILFEAMRKHVLNDPDSPPPSAWIAAHVAFVLDSLAVRRAS